jgi:type IV pilus assembly protein PilB
MMQWCFRCRSAVEVKGEHCSACGSRLGVVLDGGSSNEPLKPARLGFVSKSELTVYLSQMYGAPEINLDEWDVDPQVIALVDAAYAVARRVVPVNRAGASLIVAMEHPDDSVVHDELRARTGCNIEVVISGPDRMDRALRRYYGARP